MLRIVGKDPEKKISLLLDYTDHPRDVADPWYTGDFDKTYEDILAGCQGFLAFLQQQEKQHSYNSPDTSTNCEE